MKENKSHRSIFLPGVDQTTPHFKKCSVTLPSSQLKSTWFCSDVISPCDLCPTVFSKCFKITPQPMINEHLLNIFDLKLVLINTLSQVTGGKSEAN